MSENNKVRATKNGSGMSAAEESYRMAKLLRTGNRELERQLNSKKTKRVR
ncbi:MAG: hypothetical protein IJO91_11060 [Oscillospiraceae bacterium]|nr:hypothetical protein [Oscillospiraceae bacterium]